MPGFIDRILFPEVVPEIEAARPPRRAEARCAPFAADLKGERRAIEVCAKAARAAKAAKAATRDPACRSEKSSSTRKATRTSRPYRSLRARRPAWSGT